MSTPLSWLVIEPGWSVHARNGEEVGRVEDVVGAPEDDIFSGLFISTGLFSARFVPSERVGPITEGRIELDLDAGEIEGLDEHPPGE